MAHRAADAEEKENPAKRPETKEGGREEEEKRLGISAAPTGAGRLRRFRKGEAGVHPRLTLCGSGHWAPKFRNVVKNMAMVGWLVLI